MNIPEVLNLCIKLTSQKFVSECLDTQGHVVSKWVKGTMACLRRGDYFDHLLSSVAKVYRDYPEIEQYVNSIEVKLNDPKHIYATRRKNTPGRRSLYSKPMGLRETKRRGRVKVDFGATGKRKK